MPVYLESLTTLKVFVGMFLITQHHSSLSRFFDMSRAKITVIALRVKRQIEIEFGRARNPGYPVSRIYPPHDTVLNGAISLAGTPS